MKWGKPEPHLATYLPQCVLGEVESNKFRCPRLPTSKCVILNQSNPWGQGTLIYSFSMFFYYISGTVLGSGNTAKKMIHMIACSRNINNLVLENGSKWIMTKIITKPKFQKVLGMPSCARFWPSFSLRLAGSDKSETAVDRPVERVGGEMQSWISCHSLALGTTEQVNRKEKRIKCYKKAAWRPKALWQGIGQTTFCQSHLFHVTAVCPSTLSQLRPSLPFLQITVAAPCLVLLPTHHDAASTRSARNLCLPRAEFLSLDTSDILGGTILCYLELFCAL